MSEEEGRKIRHTSFKMREIYSQLIAIRIAEGVGDISNKLNNQHTEIFGYVDQSATRKIVKGAMGLMI